VLKVGLEWLGEEVAVFAGGEGDGEGAVGGEGDLVGAVVGGLDGRGGELAVVPG
jgi:hypothetical protein